MTWSYQCLFFIPELQDEKKEDRDDNSTVNEKDYIYENEVQISLPGLFGFLCPSLCYCKVISVGVQKNHMHHVIKKILIIYCYIDIQHFLYIKCICLLSPQSLTVQDLDCWIQQEKYVYFIAQLNQSFIMFILPFKTTHSIKYFQICYGQKSNFSEHS